eukprot:COSAG05_NODE_1635_length_4366_cov_25.922428_2_plen_73_part_00
MLPLFAVGQKDADGSGGGGGGGGGGQRTLDAVLPAHAKRARVLEAAERRAVAAAAGEGGEMGKGDRRGKVGK